MNDWTSMTLLQKGHDVLIHLNSSSKSTAFSVEMSVNSSIHAILSDGGKWYSVVQLIEGRVVCHLSKVFCWLVINGMMHMLVMFDVESRGQSQTYTLLMPNIISIATKHSWHREFGIRHQQQ